MSLAERIARSYRDEVLRALAVIGLLLLLVLYVGVTQAWFEFTNAMSLTFIVLTLIVATATLLLSRER